MIFSQFCMLHPNTSGNIRYEGREILINFTSLYLLFFSLAAAFLRIYNICPCSAGGRHEVVSASVYQKSKSCVWLRWLRPHHLEYKPRLQVVSGIIIVITGNESIWLAITINKQMDFWKTFVSRKHRTKDKQYLVQFKVCDFLLTTRRTNYCWHFQCSSCQKSCLILSTIVGFSKLTKRSRGYKLQPSGVGLAFLQPKLSESSKNKVHVLGSKMKYRIESICRKHWQA